MEARGLRKRGDIDIVATPSLYEKLKEQGWKEKDTIEGRRKLVWDDVEVYREFWCGEYRPQTEELILDAEIIGGIPFLSLENLLVFKRVLGREKDLVDVDLISEYLQVRDHGPKSSI